jgi:uncharacterized protein
MGTILSNKEQQMTEQKLYIGDLTLKEAVNQIGFAMFKDNWRPDYIVGITRGGLVPAVMLSHALGIPMHTLDVRLRDTSGNTGLESNLWMAEDAFGYNRSEETGITGARWDISLRKNILILDDINDTGATFNWIKQDWQSGCLPNEDTWNTVWHKNVRFASIVDNQSSAFDVDYSAKEINKAENDTWVVFPWEH